jgi:sporulation protein YlmC with PRC-barrel domain
MLFKEHADVVTSHGEKIGRIDRVVVDPANDEVTHLVVKKGLLLTRDKVIPVDQIDSTTEQQVLLKKDASNPDEFPDFEETQHIPVADSEEFKRREAERAREVIWYHTRVNIPWWSGGPTPNRPKPLFVKKTRRNIPEGTIALEEGARVVDAVGDSVGEIEEEKGQKVLLPLFHPEPGNVNCSSIPDLCRCRKQNGRFR